MRFRFDNKDNNFNYPNNFMDFFLNKLDVGRYMHPLAELGKRKEKLHLK